MNKGGLIGAVRDKQKQMSEGSGGTVPGNSFRTTPSGSVMTPRPHPLGIRNVSHDERAGTVSFEFKAVTQFWWLAAPAIAGGAGILLVMISPFIAAVFAARYEAPAFGLWFTITALIGIAAFVFAILRTRPWVTIEGTKDRITVRETKNPMSVMRFDRKHFGGMRKGYSIQTDSGALITSMTEPRFGFSALRLTYGPWGEDLKYLVNAHHADEMVIWMNMALGSVDMPAPKAHAPELGIVEEVF